MLIKHSSGYIGMGGVTGKRGVTGRGGVTSHITVVV